MRRRIIFDILYLVLSISSFPVSAQEGRNTSHATLVGIGAVNHLDTYLSPLNYKGPQLQFMHETLRYTRWAQGHISMQSIWQGNIAYTKSPSEKGRNYGGDINYSIGWHYNWTFPSNNEAPRLRILLGPQLGANAGVLYNTRNSNNPAQALATLHLAASAAVIYRFHLWKQPVAARYQLDVPLMGLKFSPNYGQSYYEIFSLGNTDHNVCFTHPFNAFSSRHLLTLDFPFRQTTLRMGYLCDIRQSHLNELKYHSYTHAFMLGIVRHLTIHKPRRHTPEGFIL